MKYFVLLCICLLQTSCLDSYVEGIVEKRAPFRAEHLALAKELHEKGTLFMIGAYNNPADGATIIFQGENEDVIKEWLDRDPYYANGLVTDYKIREWMVVPM